MPSTSPQAQPDAAGVLAKALVNAGKALGLTQQGVGEVIGKDRSSIARGVDPASKSGELALLLIRLYRSLYVLVGGDPADMRHWLNTHNLHVGGVPAQQIRSINGLTRVVGYLDSLRGKS